MFWANGARAVALGQDSLVFGCMDRSLHIRVYRR